MTGTGTGTASSDKGSVEIEIRTVNARFLDISCRFPRSWEGLEENVKAVLKKKLNRGRVSVTGRWAVDPETPRTEVDPEALESTMQLLATVREAAGLEDKPRLDHLLMLERCWMTAPAPPETVPDLVEHALMEAIETLLGHRAQEAERLVADMRARLRTLSEMTDTVRRESPERAARVQGQLRERVESLLEHGARDAELDEARLSTELALAAQRLDTTEECVRLSAHIEHFEGLLEQGSPVGRKLEFLLQEMHRECATLGAKANDAPTSQLVVDMKAELEKLREQAANLE
jgi:uncharacterized protein (TIGR00255 family)